MADDIIDISRRIFNLVELVRIHEPDSLLVAVVASDVPIPGDRLVIPDFGAVRVIQDEDLESNTIQVMSQEQYLKRGG